METNLSLPLSSEVGGAVLPDWRGGVLGTFCQNWLKRWDTSWWLKPHTWNVRGIAKCVTQKKHRCVFPRHYSRGHPWSLDQAQSIALKAETQKHNYSTSVFVYFQNTFTRETRYLVPRTHSKHLEPLPVVREGRGEEGWMGRWGKNFTECHRSLLRSLRVHGC